jgi:hypothetical protein
MAVVDAVDKECRGIGSAWILRRSVRMVIAFAWCFYTLFLFDTLGDQTGFRNAYWVLIVTPLMPLVMFVVYKCWGWLQPSGGAVVYEASVRVDQNSGEGTHELESSKGTDVAGETFNILAKV